MHIASSEASERTCVSADSTLLVKEFLFSFKSLSSFKSITQSKKLVKSSLAISWSLSCPCFTHMAVESPHLQREMWKNSQRIEYWGCQRQHHALGYFVGVSFEAFLKGFSSMLHWNQDRNDAVGYASKDLIVDFARSFSWTDLITGLLLLIHLVKFKPAFFRYTFRWL